MEFTSNISYGNCIINDFDTQYLCLPALSSSYLYWQRWRAKAGSPGLLGFVLTIICFPELILIIHIISSLTALPYASTRRQKKAKQHFFFKKITSAFTNTYICIWKNIIRIDSLFFSLKDIFYPN